jgi:hypothetical protein
MRCVHRKNLKKNVAQGFKDCACSLEITKFYMAEVVVALQYLHEQVRCPPQLFSHYTSLTPFLPCVISGRYPS